MLSSIFSLISIFLIFSFLQIFLWKIILENFRLSRIYYEESSWFDTQVWQKPSFLIRKDKLFANQKIKSKIIILYKKTKIFFIFAILLSLLKSL